MVSEGERLRERHPLKQAHVGGAETGRAGGRGGQERTGVVGATGAVPGQGSSDEDDACYNASISDIYF